MPKGWFGPKKIGHGIGPRSWQGWLATLLFVAILLASLPLVPSLASYFGVPRPLLTGLTGIVVLGAYLLLVWATYDREA